MRACPQAAAAGRTCIRRVGLMQYFEILQEILDYFLLNMKGKCVILAKSAIERSGAYDLE
jgi:hypothetical protein